MSFSIKDPEGNICKPGDVVHMKYAPNNSGRITAITSRHVVIEANCNPKPLRVEHENFTRKHYGFATLWMKS
jgi:hypothetical protein